MLCIILVIQVGWLICEMLLSKKFPVAFVVYENVFHLLLPTDDIKRINNSMRKSWSRRKWMDLQLIVYYQVLFGNSSNHSNNHKKEQTYVVNRLMRLYY